MKLKSLPSALLAAAALAALARFSFADTIELPARGISADSQIVIRADVAAVSADTLEKSKAIIIAMLGDAAKDAGPTKDQWQQALDARDALTKAGARQIVLVMGSFPQGPGDEFKPMFLIKMKPGTDPAALEKAIADTDAAAAKRTGDPAAMEKISVKPLDSDWAYVDGANFAAPAAAGDPKNLAAFQTSLAAQDGAPIRIAFQLNDATKTSLATNAANPQIPPFIKNIFDGLQTLQTASAGLTTGDTLKLKINANFPTADAAASFKKAIDTALTVIGAAAPPEAQAQVAVATVLLTMKADGPALTNNTDSDQLKAAIKATQKEPAAPPAGGPTPLPQN